MYDGTLGTKGPWQALVAFQQLIILADKEGVVDMTPDALARRTTIPLEIIEKGIDALELPDPDSRSPDEEGRRIVRLSDDRSWGWRIVNYDHYRKLRSEEERREYHKLYARKRRASTKRQQVNTASTESTKAVSSKQDAKAVSTTSSSREELLTIVPNRKAWDAEMRGALDGLRGHVLTSQQIEDACRDYLGNGGAAQPNLAQFRAYLRRAGQAAKEPLATPDDQTAELTRWAREAEAKERANA